MVKVARGALVAGMTLIASALIPATVFAEGTTGGIHGHVYIKGTNRPAGSVLVRVLSSTEPDQVTRTRPDGSFGFAAVFPGDVTLAIGAEGTRLDVHANLESDATIFVSEEVADGS